ncbi:hypothetical protein TorRG33x02_303550 [Trema orientale]|uniref:Uncharacterized protein n=1 Tax=Trema orientale TaxID=63057 RepID=A0A2P5BZ89_TREOI|nr:hypothetical protein TorRG33x02_303550 [Trema orientale]
MVVGGGRPEITAFSRNLGATSLPFFSRVAARWCPAMDGVASSGKGSQLRPELGSRSTLVAGGGLRKGKGEEEEERCVGEEREG